MEEKCLSKNERMSRFLTNCQKAIFWLFPFALLQYIVKNLKTV